MVSSADQAALSRERIINVLLDTNIILYHRETHFDFENELIRLIPCPHQIIVISPIIDELKQLQKYAPSIVQKRQYAFALALAKKFKVIEYEGGVGESADTAIQNFSQRNNVVVCTNDLELRRQLRAKNIPVIYIRQKRHLALDGLIREIQPDTELRK